MSTTEESSNNVCGNLVYRLVYITSFNYPLPLTISHKDIFTFVDCILVKYQVILYSLCIPRFENKCKLQANPLAHKVIAAELLQSASLAD